MGWLCREPGSVGTCVPRLRLHRRQVVLARRGLARGQRRFLAPLAPAPGRTRGPAHRRSPTTRTRRSAGRSDRCSSASTAYASPTRHWRIASRSRRRIRSGGPSGFTDCSTSAARSRRRRSPRWCPRSPTPSRVRPSCSRSCATASRWRSGTPRVRSARASSPPMPAHDEARSLLAAAEQVAAQAPPAGRNDPCPCGSGKRYKHCHGALGPAASAAPPAADADARVRDAMAVHQRGDLEAAERGYRAALARCAGASDGDALPRRVAVSARKARGGAAPARGGRRRGPAGSRVPQQPRARARGGGQVRRSDRRAPAGARAPTRARDRVEQPRARAAGGKSAAGSNRCVSPRNRARPRFRAGTLEPRPRAPRAPGFRGGLARIRVAPPNAGIRAPRARVAGTALGWRGRRRAHAAGDLRAGTGRHACSSSAACNRSRRAGRASS